MSSLKVLRLRFRYLVCILLANIPNLLGCVNAGAPPQIDIRNSPELVGRGDYLVNHVVGCVVCHSQRDWEYFSGPVKVDGSGGGGKIYDESNGFPGHLRAVNITPTALADWSDGEIAHAIVAGVDKNGEALFPVMPYPYFRSLCRDDVHAIVSYIRTLAPLPYTRHARRLNFPLNIIVKTIPQKWESPECPDPYNELAYGQYLAEIAFCGSCHTPSSGGKADPSRFFSGGREFVVPGVVGKVRSSNLTPHETGLGQWSRARFVGRFKAFEDPEVLSQALPVGSFNTEMSWHMYTGLSEADLGALYVFLTTLQPIDNRVETWNKP